MRRTLMPSKGGDGGGSCGGGGGGGGGKSCLNNHIYCGAVSQGARGIEDIDGSVAAIWEFSPLFGWAEVRVNNNTLNEKKAYEHSTFGIPR